VRRPGLTNPNFNAECAIVRFSLSVGPVLVALGLVCCTRGDSPPATRQALSIQEQSTRLREAAKAIVLCQTTDSTLRRQLGDPSRNGAIHGEHIMSWIVFDTDPSLYLAVLLDSAGIVVDEYWDVPTEVPWVPTNQCEHPGATHEVP